MDDPRSIYEKAIVVDMTCPAAVMENILRDYRKGGFTVIAVTAGYGMRMKKYGPMEHTLRSLGMWLERIRASEDFVLVTSVEDIHRAKREGKLGILFHFQGTRPLEGDLNSLEAYYRMGLRVLQLCYNVKDLAGCGCTVTDDTGLTDFGRASWPRRIGSGWSWTARIPARRRRWMPSKPRQRPSSSRTATPRQCTPTTAIYPTS